MTRALAIGTLLLLASGPLNATEKYWIVHEAKLIVVGTLHPHPTFIFPWFDGWRIEGTIDVEEVLFGDKTAGPIPYQWTCNYSRCNDWRAVFSSRIPPIFREKGLWFLKPLDDRTWQPSDGIGYVDIKERANYLRQIGR